MFHRHVLFHIEIYLLQVLRNTTEGDRPNSRLAYVAMAPEKSNHAQNRMLRRPLSATKNHRPVSATSIKGKLKNSENTDGEEKPSAIEESEQFFADLEKRREKEIEKQREKERKQREKEREKQIEDLINKHIRRPHSASVIENGMNGPSTMVENVSCEQFSDTEEFSTEVPSPRQSVQVQ